MGKKYTRLSDGTIRAERDIYSLGGFIPKGSLGSKIASEEVLSQDGECWIVTSDKVVPNTIKVRDNAFIWQFVSESVYTQTEHVYSGDTYIPCNLSPQNISETYLPRQSMYIHNTYFASEMEALFGTAATMFFVEQGTYDYSAGGRGRLFDNLRTDVATSVRTTASPVIGEATQLYVPTGFQARIYWAYIGDYGSTSIYSGESQVLSAGLHDLTGSIYKLCRVTLFRSNATNLTPAEAQAAGFRIIRSPKRAAQNSLIPASENSRSALLKDCSIYKIMGNYSAEYWNNLYVAGSAENCNIEFATPGAAVGVSIKGKFRNIGYMRNTATQDSQIYTNVGRDTQCIAIDCPYLAITNETFRYSNGVTLRNCILPKGLFVDNLVNRNVYENIDFSFASEHVGANAGNVNFMLTSGCKQGLYFLTEKIYSIPVALVSYPGNVPSGAAVGSTNTNNPNDIAQITGYSYIGSGVYLYGDIQLHSQPYINRWISANMWERGAITYRLGASWENMKIEPQRPNRMIIKDLIPVRGGDIITCATGYYMFINGFDEDKKAISEGGGSPFTARYTVASNLKYVGIVLKKAATLDEAGDLILPSDVLTAAVKYQSTPRTLRYITNEADRTSPDDTLIGPSAWKIGYITNVAANVGKTYDEVLNASAGGWLSGKLPFNADPNNVTSVMVGSGWNRVASSFNASLRLSAEADTNEVFYAPSVRKDPETAITPNDITAARFVIAYRPMARIVLPYGRGAISISGKVRLYDNAVMAMTTGNLETNIVLKGNTVLTNIASEGYRCSCTEGEDEAVITT